MTAEEQKIYDKLIEFGLGEIPNDENVTMYYPALVDAIKEYAKAQYNQGVRDAADGAEVEIDGQEHIEKAWVDKQSILKLLKP